MERAQENREALGLALVPEGSDQQGLRREAQRLAKTPGFLGRRQHGPLKQVRDLDNLRVRGMFADQCRGGGIVHDHRARGRGDVV